MFEMPSKFDAGKIISGGATVFIKDKDDIVYTNVGFTRDGVTIRKSRDSRDLLADQSFYPIDVSITSEGFEVAFKVYQSTYANFKSIWGEPGRTKVVDGKVKGVFGISSASEVKYKSLKICGLRKDGKAVEYEFLKCVQVSFGEHTLVRDGDAMIEATFRVIWDTDAEAMGYFTPGVET